MAFGDRAGVGCHPWGQRGQAEGLVGGKEEEPSWDLPSVMCQGEADQAAGVQFSCCLLCALSSCLCSSSLLLCLGINSFRSWQLSPPGLASSPTSCLALGILSGFQ